MNPTIPAPPALHATLKTVSAAMEQPAASRRYANLDAIQRAVLLWKCAAAFELRQIGPLLRIVSEFPDILTAQLPRVAAVRAMSGKPTRAELDAINASHSGLSFVSAALEAGLPQMAMIPYDAGVLSIDHPVSHGIPLLHRAVQAADVALVEACVLRGARFTAVPNANPPLYEALKNLTNPSMAKVSGQILMMALGTSLTDEDLNWHRQFPRLPSAVALLAGYASWTQASDGSGLPRAALATIFRELGASIDEPSGTAGLPPVLVACGAHNEEALLWLIGSGADISTSHLGKDLQKSVSQNFNGESATRLLGIVPSASILSATNRNKTSDNAPKDYSGALAAIYAVAAQEQAAAERPGALLDQIEAQVAQQAGQPTAAPAAAAAPAPAEVPADDPVPPPAPRQRVRGGGSSVF